MRLGLVLALAVIVVGACGATNDDDLNAVGTEVPPTTTPTPSQPGLPETTAQSNSTPSTTELSNVEPPPARTEIDGPLSGVWAILERTKPEGAAHGTDLRLQIQHFRDSASVYAIEIGSCTVFSGNVSVGDTEVKSSTGDIESMPCEQPHEDSVGRNLAGELQRCFRDGCAFSTSNDSMTFKVADKAGLSFERVAP